MNILLADSIDGGIFALLIVCGGGATSLLALAALSSPLPCGETSR